MTQAFANAGSQVITCSPFYKDHIVDPDKYHCVFKGVEALQDKPFEVWRSDDDPLHTYIYNEEYFGRPYVYGPPHSLPYSDNHLRFAMFASAVLTYCAQSDFKFQAILGHEWGGALVGALCHTVYQETFHNIPFFFNVHNITYDFHVQPSEIEKIGLPRKDFNMDGYEFWGKVSLLKAGILYANKVLFPSSGYRDAMLNTNLPGGLSGFLNRNSEKLLGIQFGVNYKFWDFNDEAKRPIKEAKRTAKASLGRQFGMDLTNKLIIYSHMDMDSGNASETLATILSDIAKENALIIVGIPPEHPEWNYYQEVSHQYGNFIRILQFDSEEANNREKLRDTLAASDILFAANLQEPSASIILKAMAAGTLPLTGRNVGIASMLTDYTLETAGEANAFLVDDANAPHQMLRRIKDAINVYNTEVADWDKCVVNAYSGFHYEWAKTISKYLLILGELGL
jgi:starch synthase